MTTRKTRRIIAVLMVMCFIAMGMTSSLNVSATEEKQYSKEELLCMEQEQLLETLEEKGLHLPDYYKENPSTAEYFVSAYTPLLIEGKIDTSVDSFNYGPSNEMLRSLETTLIDIDVIKGENKRTPTRYTLQHSTPIGSWINSYVNYNCYAYSIGRTSRLQPGALSNTPFNNSLSVSAMADVVLADLNVLGYWGYKTTTKPSSLPDSYFRVICVRKNNQNVDYHIMKISGSLNTWVHKPGGTQPLKWNYSSPGHTIWTNERVIQGTVYPSNIHYNSPIYYIVYKGKKDPGVQPRNLKIVDRE